MIARRVRIDYFSSSMRIRYLRIIKYIIRFSIELSCLRDASDVGCCGCATRANNLFFYLNFSSLLYSSDFVVWICFMFYVDSLLWLRDTSKTIVCSPYLNPSLSLADFLFNISRKYKTLTSEPPSVTCCSSLFLRTICPNETD